MGAFLRSDKAGIAGDLERVFQKLPRLKERLNQDAGTLSGGEQQMLAIGRGLMAKPQLLLMDEPTEGLAPILVDQVGSTIDRLKKEGHSMVLVEQNVPFAIARADYVYIMSKGKIVYQSTPKKLEEDKQAKLRYIGV